MPAHWRLGRFGTCFVLLAGCNAVSGIDSWGVRTDAPASTPVDPATAVGGTDVGDGSSEKDEQAAAPPPRPSEDGGVDSGTVRHVFVTSTKAGSSLGGASGADTICRDRASEAGHPGNWVAWLSSTTSTFSALDRITAEGPWYLFDHTLAVASRAELTSGEITHGIDVDEKGTPNIADDVWTGTNATAGGDAPTDCRGWKGYSCISDCPSGTSGRTDTRTGAWTNAVKTPCGTGNQRLYCFEN